MQNYPEYDCLWHELYIAYRKARKGKRKTMEEHLFELNDIENLKLLAEEIKKPHLHTKSQQSIYYS